MNNFISVVELKDVKLIKEKTSYGDYDYYLKITYKLRDNKRNEYVMVIPKVELPFIKNDLPNIVVSYDDYDEICSVTKLDKGLEAKLYNPDYEKSFIKLNNDKLYLKKGDCSYKIDGKVYDDTDKYFTVFNTKKAPPVKITKKELEKRLGYEIEIIDEGDEE